jgi:hypothetical protein
MKANRSPARLKRTAVIDSGRKTVTEPVRQVEIDRPKDAKLCGSSMCLYQKWIHSRVGVPFTLPRSDL